MAEDVNKTGSRKISATLTLYVIRETIPFYVITIITLTFIIFAQQIIRQNDFLSVVDVPFRTLMASIACILPGILIITTPFSALIATLLTINRFSSDRETTSIMASGLKSRQIALPVIITGLLATALTLVFTLYLNPRCLQFLNTLKLEALKRAVEIQVKPQTLTTLFNDQLVLVRNVTPETGQWKGIFVYHPTPDNKIVIVSAAKGNVRIEADRPDVNTVGIQMEDGFTATTSAENHPTETITRFKRLYVRLSDSASTPLAATRPVSKRAYQELSSGQLKTQLRTLAPDSTEYRAASVEWHKRLAMAFGAIVLVIIAIPTGLSLSARSGRAFTVITGLIIAVTYYILTVTGQNLAFTGAIPVVAGTWLANIVILTLSFIIPNRPVPALKSPFPALRLFNRGHRSASVSERPLVSEQRTRNFRVFDIVNLLLLKNLTAYSILTLAALLSLTVIFTLTDLVPSVARNRIPTSYLAGYFWYLTPYLIYLCAPFGLMLGLLITFGLLARTNQLTALSANGLSPYKFAIALTAFAVLISSGLYYLSEQIIPESNRRQDERYNTIKNRKTEQATLAFGRKWVYSLDDKLFSFQHINDNNQLLNATAYDIGGPSHLLCSVTHADKAEQISNNTWQSVSGGWQEEFCNAPGPLSPPGQSGVTFTASQGAALFRKPVNESSKMNIRELGSYLRQLSASGISAAELKIDYEKKKSFPLYCLIFISLAFPFCLTLTSRKILTRLTTGLSLCLIFWTITSVLESLGRQGRLSAELAVWGGPAAFLALGIYLFFRIGK
ncbi:MAG: LptF/LptG family permease [Blastocatellia bacterium]